MLLVLPLSEGASSVSLAFPPAGWQSTVGQPAHRTTVCAFVLPLLFWGPVEEVLHKEHVLVRCLSPPERSENGDPRTEDFRYLLLNDKPPYNLVA